MSKFQPDWPYLAYAPSVHVTAYMLQEMLDMKWAFREPLRLVETLVVPQMYAVVMYLIN
jgi:hypothetical protein